MITIYVSGQGFKPSLFRHYIPNVSILAETGITSTKGRYKGTPSPYGLCYYEINNNGDFYLTVEKHLSELKKIPLKPLNITEIEFEDKNNSMIYEPWSD